MAPAELATLTLAAVVIFFAVLLALANQNMGKFAAKALEHAMAWHEDQRYFMETKFRAEHQEMLLREARSREERRSRIPTRQPEEPPPPPMIPIESDTTT